MQLGFTQNQILHTNLVQQIFVSAD